MKEKKKEKEEKEERKKKRKKKDSLDPGWRDLSHFEKDFLQI